MHAYGCQPADEPLERVHLRSLDEHLVAAPGQKVGQVRASSPRQGLRLLHLEHSLLCGGRTRLAEHRLVIGGLCLGSGVFGAALGGRREDARGGDEPAAQR